MKKSPPGGGGGSHFVVALHLDKALPELDNLHGDKKTDGHQVGEENPEGDQQNKGVSSSILVVALQENWIKLSLTIERMLMCDRNSATRRSRAHPA